MCKHTLTYVYDSAIEEKVARATLAAVEAADGLDAHGARSMLVVHLDSLFQSHAGGGAQRPDADD
jgi:hypothetical protein